MRIVRAEEVEQLSGAIPDEAQRIAPQWWEGPHDDGRLNAGVVTLSPGGITPPHIHIGGQVMIVTAGRGFVEVDGDRFELAPGDVVVTPAGELHTHGAAPDRSFSHLNVTGGGYTFPTLPLEGDGPAAAER
jgi:quercetin dioxygenase-like cupin family protein